MNDQQAHASGPDWKDSLTRYVAVGVDQHGGYTGRGALTAILCVPLDEIVEAEADGRIVWGGWHDAVVAERDELRLGHLSTEPGWAEPIQAMEAEIARLTAERDALSDELTAWQLGHDDQVNTHLAEVGDGHDQGTAAQEDADIDGGMC